MEFSENSANLSEAFVRITIAGESAGGWSVGHLLMNRELNNIGGLIFVLLNKK